jgi:ferredoxin
MGAMEHTQVCMLQERPQLLSNTFLEDIQGHFGTEYLHLQALRMGAQAQRSSCTGACCRRCLPSCPAAEVTNSAGYRPHVLRDFLWLTCIFGAGISDGAMLTTEPSHGRMLQEKPPLLSSSWDEAVYPQQPGESFSRIYYLTPVRSSLSRPPS